MSVGAGVVIIATTFGDGVGISVGGSLGELLGGAEGCRVGRDVGDNVIGPFEGAEDGDWLGSADCLRVGDVVGTSVGDIEPLHEPITCHSSIVASGLTQEPHE